MSGCPARASVGRKSASCSTHAGGRFAPRSASSVARRQPFLGRGGAPSVGSLPTRSCVRPWGLSAPRHRSLFHRPLRFPAPM
eukprot:6266040-Lingulodinium_polyedra.AAC.1